MNSDSTKVIAARHICEEASKVLSILRRSHQPSHGSHVHNLRELRRKVKARFLHPINNASIAQSHDEYHIPSYTGEVGSDNGDYGGDGDAMESNVAVDDIHNIGGKEVESSASNNDGKEKNELVIVDKTKFQDSPELDTDAAACGSMDVDIETESATFTTADVSVEEIHNPHHHQHSNQQHVLIVQVGVFAQPFLDIILDPMAAGPHTLVALRSLHRLVSRQTLVLTNSSPQLSQTSFGSKVAHKMDDLTFRAEMEPLMRGILECRFEQTDAGADEAVEMAIADLLSLIVSLDYDRVMNAEVVMEAFNTVFVTRNTFVHSPALCYHFEQVLEGIIRDLFANMNVKSSKDGQEHCAIAAKLIIEFLVNQLLHTPMTLEDNGSLMRSGSMEAFAMHNDTRILCFRLIQTCLKIGWGDEYNPVSQCNGIGETKLDETEISDQASPSPAMAGILKIVKDDLCLSLLLIGQGIWAYQDPSSGALPGMISMNVLSEICSTLSTLWSITPLRNILTTQFETIFTGFYQRALSLLRRLPVPHESATFHANQIFDAEVEVILESLVDILSLHSDNANRGAFESLFITYDCNMNRPDVAAGIVDELSRCCSNSNIIGIKSQDRDNSVGGDSISLASNAAPPSTGSMTPVRQSNASINSLEGDFVPNIRDVPAHLRELCAEALTGVMRTIFFSSNDTVCQSLQSSDDDTPLQTPLRLLKERKTLMREAVDLFNEKSSAGFKFLTSHGLMEEPVTPKKIACFLRNGIVLGLDKRAVGEYLGSKGKSPVAGKSPPDWERDWFHKEALLAYCSSFHFKGQSLLDGLRMFLASFRLPGEAQQIDRILQAFAESCGLQCEESQSGRLKLFSTDPKKASDAAYLLSFSIIMLNTDLHNDNIRQDRKMKVEDFVKNNTDYGRDITDPDKTLPREYLEGIYERIKDEQIRTEGEGANGVMTFERWKDVMRDSGDHKPTIVGEENVSDIMLDIVQKPILSAICGFWGVSMKGESILGESRHSGMIGVQGARFGMDLSLEMVTGLKEFSKKKLFQEFFVSICYLTGLLGEYKGDAVERTSSFVESVERQSAVVVVMKIASEHGDFIGTNGWSCIFGIIFELRDLKLLGGGTNIKHRSLIIESDPDLLRSDTRRDWEMRLVKQCYEATGGMISGSQSGKKRSGLFGAVGRALFGSETSDNASVSQNIHTTKDSLMTNEEDRIKVSVHGKEELVLWDDLAPSDEEGEEFDEEEYQHLGVGREVNSLGDEFVRQLIEEDNIKSQPGPPITGLETYEDTRLHQISPRARVRKRLSKLCNFSSILSETRFLDSYGVTSLLQALALLINGAKQERSSNDEIFVLSPGSQALAEVMITEIALKNRDRIGALWSSTLRCHYENRLSQKPDGHPIPLSVDAIPVIEKSLTGLLRICYHTVHRDGVNDDVLKTLTHLSSYCNSFASPIPALHFNKHIAEGLWRICRDVDGLLMVGEDGWTGILDLLKHCARGGEVLISDDDFKSKNLSDDDPALQAFRCMHLILHSVELRDVVPLEIIHSVRALIIGGERKNCPKLSLAGLDLLLVLLTRLQLAVNDESNTANTWKIHWFNIIEGIAEASDSKFSNTRQHSMTMLRDALIDRHSEDSPIKDLCRILNGVCMPVISQRISELVQHQIMLKFDQEEILIELELCISTIFKPFMHHLEKILLDTEEFTAVWMSLLSVLSHLLGKESSQENERRTNDHLLKTAMELATEHLRNAVMTLISKGQIKVADDDISRDGRDLSSMTWNALSNISHCKSLIPEWKQSVKNRNIQSTK